MKRQIPGCKCCGTPVDDGTIPVANCICSRMPSEFFYQYQYTDPTPGNPNTWHESAMQGQTVRYNASTPAIYLAGAINGSGADDIQAGQLGPGWYSDIITAVATDPYGNPANPPSQIHYFHYLRCTSTVLQFSTFYRSVNSPQGKFYRNYNGVMGSFAIRAGNACSPFCFTVPSITFAPAGYAYRPGDLAPYYQIQAGCVTPSGGTPAAGATAQGDGVGSFGDGSNAVFGGD